MLGDARPGKTRTVLTERDSAWVDVVRRPALDRRRQELHLDQRARRVAAPLRRLARRREEPAGHPGRVRPPQSGERVRRAATSWAWTPPPDRSTTPPRRTTRRSSISTARGSTARGSRSASRRRTSRATTTTRSRRTAAGRSTPSRASVRPPVVELVSLPEPPAGAHAGGEPPAQGRGRRLRRGPGRVHQGGRGRRARSSTAGS